MNKSLSTRVQDMNFKRSFLILVLTSSLLLIAFVSYLTISGNWSEAPALTRLWERVTLTGLRDRLFTDLFVTFRVLGTALLTAFAALTGLWLYAKRSSTRTENHR